jgi:hypothetical protein
MHGDPISQFVTFSADQFSKEPRQHYINPCCQCEDLGVWIRDQVASAFPAASIALFQEDFGWVVEIRPLKRSYTIMVVASDLDEDRTTDEFGLYVAIRESLLSRIRRKFLREPDPSVDLSEVIHALEKSLHRENEIEHIRWWQGGFMCGDPTRHPNE